MTNALDDTIRKLAAAGEITHFSLVPSQDGKMWRASYAMCSKFGISFAEHKDPVEALLLAFTTAKLKRPRAKVDLKASLVEPELETQVAPEAEVVDAAADLM